MKNLINDLVDKFKYSEAVEKENLVFYPIFMDANPDQAEYLLLDEAMARGILEVSEVSDAGSVNVIAITNTAEKSVLVFDGDELIGAKQNRMVNTTIIIPGKSRINIPVSCVERGRWHRKSKNFKSSDVFGYCELRKQKAEQVAENLACESSFSANQSKIWSEIDRKQAKMGSFSGTDALHDVYKDKRRTMEEYINGIKPLKGQVGVAAFISGRFSCMDVFDSYKTLKKVWKKLIRSYAMEALECLEKNEAGEKPALNDVLSSIRKTSLKRYKSVGRGDDIRLSSEDIIGAGLFDDSWLAHLSVFGKELKH